MKLEEQSALPNLKCVGGRQSLGYWHRMPRFVETSVTRVALVCWSVPVVRGGSWIARFSQTLANVATVSQVAERKQPKRGTVRIM